MRPCPCPSVAVSSVVSFVLFFCCVSVFAGRPFICLTAVIRMLSRFPDAYLLTDKVGFPCCVLELLGEHPRLRFRLRLLAARPFRSLRPRPPWHLECRGPREMTKQMTKLLAKMGQRWCTSKSSVRVATCSATSLLVAEVGAVHFVLDHGMPSIQKRS